MRAKDAVGRYGEDVAVRHLTEAGLEIVERNWRCSAGEIDIVARERDVLVICEVKTRSSVLFGLPTEAITARKRDRMRRLAHLWLTQQSTYAPEVRFDVVSVVRPDRGAAIVEHLRGAF